MSLHGLLHIEIRGSTLMHLQNEFGNTNAREDHGRSGSQRAAHGRNERSNDQDARND